MCEAVGRFGGCQTIYTLVDLGLMWCFLGSSNMLKLMVDRPAKDTKLSSSNKHVIVCSIIVRYLLGVQAASSYAHDGSTMSDDPARKFLASSPLAEGSDIYSWLSPKSAGAHRKVTDYFGMITWNCQVMGTCNGHVVHALDKVSFCKSIPNTHAAGSRVVMGVCFASFCTVNVDRPPVLPLAQNVKIQQ